MNINELKAIARRIHRVERHVYGINKASEQALTELGELQMIVNSMISDLYPPTNEGKRPTTSRAVKNRPITEADVEAAVERAITKLVAS